MIYNSLQINTQIYGGSLFLAFIIFKLFQGSIFIRKENIIFLFRNLLFLYLESIVITDTLLEKKLLQSKAEQEHEDINIQKMMGYILLMEFIYYTVHRLLHNRVLYKWIHKQHHENYNVVPGDAFYASLTENNLILFCNYLPILIFHLNILEHKIIMIFYNTGFYLSHSDIVYDHHLFHHKFHHYNYSLLIPIFDMIFGTSK